LIPRLWTALGAVILIVASAAVSAFVVLNWNPFSPRDYEDCAARAVKDAKSNDALSVLLSICKSDFKGRRKAGGGYSYLHPVSNQEFDIKGPNPTKQEIEYIARELDTYLQREAEADLAKRADELAAEQERADKQRRMRGREEVATTKVSMKILSFGCDLSCSSFDVSMKINNESEETLSQLWFRWALIPKGETTCPTDMDAWSTKDVHLPPGGSAILYDHTHSSVPTFAAPSSFRLCGKIWGVRIAGDTARAR
jgi:hypothetical protein